MGREIRRVPENWNHPKKRDGSFVAMHNFDFDEMYSEWEIEVKKWYEDRDLWRDGKYRDYDGNITPKADILKEWADDIAKRRLEYKFSTDYKGEEEELYRTGDPTYTDVAGEPPSPPNPDDYMPKGEWYQLFENVSEGTPISPPFATKEELIEWLTKNKDFIGRTWSAEAAKDIVETGFAISGIMTNGKIYTPEEQYLLKTDS